MAPVRRTDLEDSDVVDARELLSDGTTTYRSGVSVASTTNSTSTVTMTAGALLIHNDDPLEVGDKVTLAGNAAAGSYTVATVDDDDNFTVVESIVDSTGGTVDFIFQSGATFVGVDPTGLAYSANTNLQAVLEDITVSAGGIDEATHKALRHLIHFLDEGPGDGYASGAYKEVVGDKFFPTAIIWWESSAKAQKIIEKTIDRTIKVKPATVVWKMYDTDGTTVLATATDTIEYDGVAEVSRTRTIT